MTGQTLYFLVDEDLDAQVTTDPTKLTLVPDRDLELHIEVQDDAALRSVCSDYVQEFLKINKPGLYEVDIAVFPVNDSPLMRAVKSANRAIRKAFKIVDEAETVADIL